MKVTFHLPDCFKQDPIELDQSAKQQIEPHNSESLDENSDDLKIAISFTPIDNQWLYEWYKKSKNSDV